MSEYPDHFPIHTGNGVHQRQHLVKAVRHILPPGTVDLMVLCEPVKKGFQNRTKSYWYDATQLPDAVCEFYFDQAKKG